MCFLGPFFPAHDRRSVTSTREVAYEQLTSTKETMHSMKVPGTVGTEETTHSMEAPETVGTKETTHSVEAPSQA